MFGGQSSNLPIKLNMAGVMPIIFASTIVSFFPTVMYFIESIRGKEFAKGTRPVLILTTPIGYNSDRREYQNECYFYNAKGEIARGYELNDGDIFTVSEGIFDGTPEVGKFIDATYAVSASAGTDGFVGEIVEKVVYTNSISYRVLVRSIGM
jgi:hypothetical protein